MVALLDHLILCVNDVAQSVAFYRRVLGFSDEGTQGPFTVVRVNDGFTLQLAARKTQGGEHLAFAMSRAEFDEVFRRVREDGVPFGDAFHNVGSGQGPGDEQGSRGIGKAIYFFDPSKHLIEIRHYGA
jgi:catechol 2,3-dioxygenase-like lactoylglutathione lyase family enzyme